MDMVKLSIDPNERLCSQCPGGSTKMRKVQTTETWICSVCSGTVWYYANETEQTDNEENELHFGKYEIRT